MGTNYLGAALENQEPVKRAPKKAWSGKSLATYVTREDPEGNEVEVPIVVEWRMQGAEPDVGIMSGYVEVLGVTLQNEDGTDGPQLDWSQQDEDEFHENNTERCAEADEPDWDSMPGGYDSRADR